MSQNGPFPGPPWPGGSSDDEPPYKEPADPWGEHAVADAYWPATPPPIPHQPASSFHNPPMSGGSGSGGSMSGGSMSGGSMSGSPMSGGSSSDPSPLAGWGPPTGGRKRNTPIVALVVLLGLLIVAGLGAIGWLVKDQLAAKRGAQPKPSASATAGTAPATVAGSEDARFATAGECVQNLGTDDQPDMRKSVCASGTYRVLKVIKGKTNGAKDAESKCSKVTGYTNWFYYDSDLDDLDVVLCLKKE